MPTNQNRKQAADDRTSVQVRHQGPKLREKACLRILRSPNLVSYVGRMSLVTSTSGSLVTRPNETSSATQFLRSTLNHMLGRFPLKTIVNIHAEEQEMIPDGMDLQG